MFQKNQYLWLPKMKVINFGTLANLKAYLALFTSQTQDIKTVNFLDLQNYLTKNLVFLSSSTKM